MKTRSAGLVIFLLSVAAVVRARPPYPWHTVPAAGTVDSRFAPPAGFVRRAAPEGSFAAWLRGLPVYPAGREVRFWNGDLKGNQGAHAAVLAVDVGSTDLQQCADAVIRLRAEYLYAAGRDREIAFRFTSGDLARWDDWRRGSRPRVRGNRATWVAGAAPDASYASFRRYLDTVFTYAGTTSLARELAPVADPSRIEPGDVFVQPGFPGHAVTVLDVAENRAGERRFLIAQSFMPAQEIHVLRNPADPGSAWYAARGRGELRTPEWIFQYGDLRRWRAP